MPGDQDLPGPLALFGMAQYFPNFGRPLQSGKQAEFSGHNLGIGREMGQYLRIKLQSPEILSLLLEQNCRPQDFVRRQFAVHGQHLLEDQQNFRLSIKSLVSIQG